MGNSLAATVDRDKAKIAAVREAWIEAVKRGNAGELADLMTYDVVGVHGDGQCIRGKEELKRFFQDILDRYDIRGGISSSDVVIHGAWAVEIDKMETTRTQYNSAMSVDVALQAVFVFSRQLDNSWKVARVIELQDPN